MNFKRMLALLPLIAITMSFFSCAAYSSGSTNGGVVYQRSDNRRAYTVDCYYCLSTCKCECHTAHTLCSSCSEECITPETYENVRMDIVIDRYRKWPVNVEYDAFVNCCHIRSVEIGNSVASIDNGAFNGCASLETVRVYNRETLIGDGAFKSCDKLKTIIYEYENGANE